MCFVDNEWLWDQEGKKLPSTEVLTTATKKLLRYKFQKSYGKRLNMLNNKDAFGRKTQYPSFKVSIQFQIKSPYGNQEFNKKS